jgi:hypothetical protein
VDDKGERDGFQQTKKLVNESRVVNEGVVLGRRRSGLAIGKDRLDVSCVGGQKTFLERGSAAAATLPATPETGGVAE